MFEVGKRYWARNGAYRIPLVCAKRSECQVTFLARGRDAQQYLGTQGSFAKRVKADGGQECVPRLSDKHPGCDWRITDEEAPRRQRW